MTNQKNEITEKKAAFDHRAALLKNKIAHMCIEVLILARKQQEIHTSLTRRKDLNMDTDVMEAHEFLNITQEIQENLGEMELPVVSDDPPNIVFFYDELVRYDIAILTFFHDYPLVLPHIKHLFQVSKDYVALRREMGDS